MEITKLSTKGQIVIPESMRKDLEVGSAFRVMKKGNLIVLKGIEGFNKEEVEEMEELDKIWKEIDSGKCESYSVDDFFKKLKEW